MIPVVQQHAARPRGPAGAPTCTSTPTRTRTREECEAGNETYAPGQADRQPARAAGQDDRRADPAEEPLSATRRANQLIAVAMLVGLRARVLLRVPPGAAVHQRATGSRAGLRAPTSCAAARRCAIAGVDVGKVTDIVEGPGDTTTLDTGHRRPRAAAAPATRRCGSARACSSRAASTSSSRRARRTAASSSDGETLPLTQTRRPVQFHQVLTVFEQPIRESLPSRVWPRSAEGLSGGGAEGLREVAPNLEPVLRDIAIVADAAQGTEPHDVSRADRVGEPGRPPRWPTTAARWRAWSPRCGATADALSADDQRAGRDDRGGRRRCCAPRRRACAPSTARCRCVERVAARRRPAVPIAPRALRETGTRARRARRPRGARRRASARSPGCARRSSTCRRSSCGWRRCSRRSSRWPTACARTSRPLLQRRGRPTARCRPGGPVWQDFAHSLVGPGQRLAELRRQRLRDPLPVRHRRLGRSPPMRCPASAR